jgi:hypothetical protein
MGEIADMMIDGILCQYCGSFIDDDHGGYPRSCGCVSDDIEVRADQVKKRRQFEAPFFAVRGQVDFDKFSEFASTALYDKYERALDKFKNPLFRMNLGATRTATVCCRNKDFLQNVEYVIAQYKGV